MQSMKRGVGLMCVLMLAACSSMSEKECLNADWRKVGYEDGSTGKYTAIFDEYVKDCAKAKVTPDNQNYLLGRDDGLRNYCTPEHGFYLGKSGNSANSVCPYTSAADFMDSYREGSKVHQAQVRVKDLEKERTRIKEDIEKSRRADEKTKSDKERDNNARERKKLAHDLDETEDHLREAKDRLFHVEMDAHPVRH
ncbi:MAG: DUF2799 domain-containing protein [Gallionella sp.]|nr:DUF2799 domain-containing protein [Gallionella sp.]